MISRLAAAPVKKPLKNSLRASKEGNIYYTALSQRKQPFAAHFILCKHNMFTLNIRNALFCHYNAKGDFRRLFNNSAIDCAPLSNVESTLNSKKHNGVCHAKNNSKNRAHLFARIANVVFTDNIKQNKEKDSGKNT